MTEEQRLTEQVVKESYDNMMSTPYDSVVDIDEDEADYNKWYEEWKKNVSQDKLTKMENALIEHLIKDLPEGY
jgi:hypothetical protein